MANQQQDWNHIQLQLPTEAAVPADYSNIQLNLNQSSNPKDPFSGLTSAQPLNESDLSTLDRASLGSGNEQGKVEYLQQLGHEAKYNKEGELVYRKQNDKLWRFADEKNSWDLSVKSIKEMGKDVIEAAPEIVEFGLQTGFTTLAASMAAAGALATPVTAGASAPLGVAAAGATMALGTAVAKAASTSFGRVRGSYKASDAEQIGDVLMETLLNFGLGAGVRKLEIGLAPTAREVGARIKNMTTFAKGSGGVGERFLKGIYKAATNVSDDHVDVLFNEGAAIDDVLKQFPVSKSPAAIDQSLETNSISNLKNTWELLQEAHKEVGNAGRKTIIQAAKASNTPYTPEKVANNLVNNTAEMFKWKVPGKEGSKDMFFDSIEKAVIANGGKRTGVSVGMRPEEDIIALVKNKMEQGLDIEAEQLAKFLESKTSRKQMESVLNNSVNLVLGLGKQEGASGANALLLTRKQIKDKFWNMRNIAIDREKNEVLGSLFSNLHEGIDLGFKSTLDDISNGAFSTMLDQQTALFKGGAKFKQAAEKAAKEGNDSAWASVLKDFQGTSTARREKAKSLDKVFAALEDKVPKHITDGIESNLRSVDINNAATSFTPWVNPRALGLAGTLGAGTFFATDFDPRVSGGIAAAGLLGSPRLAAKAFGAAGRFKQWGVSPMVDQLSKQPEMLKGLSFVKGMTGLLKSDALKASKAPITAALFEKALDSAINLPQQKQAMLQQLMQPIEQINQESAQRQQMMMQQLQQGGGKR
jgi:hypothetical protein